MGSRKLPSLRRSCIDVESNLSMWHVVGCCVEVEGCFLGRCSVRVGYCVLLLVVTMECGTGIVRVCSGVSELVSVS